MGAGVGLAADDGIDICRPFLQKEKMIQLKHYFPSHVIPIDSLPDELRERIRDTVQKYATERIAYQIGHGRDVEDAVRSTQKRYFEVGVLERKRTTKTGRYVIPNIFADSISLVEKQLKSATYYAVAWEASDDQVKKAIKDALAIVKKRGNEWFREWVTRIY